MNFTKRTVILLKRKNKKRHKKRRVHDGRDHHHFLYQDKHWQQGYAKRLREHPYCQKLLPQDTLHRIIHSKVHDVPVPKGYDCKRVFRKLLDLEAKGKIDVFHDTAEMRLDFLIKEFAGYPATQAMLQYQKDIISEFYRSKSKPRK